MVGWQVFIIIIFWLLLVYYLSQELFFRDVIFYLLQSNKLAIREQSIAVFKESLSELQKTPLSISLLNLYSQQKYKH